MLVPLLLAVRLLGPCDTPETDPLRTVCPYLAALQKLDHKRMTAHTAPAMVSIGTDGRHRPADPQAARDIRAFERKMRTRWHYSIDSVHADSVFVTLWEANDFYDLLGVGTRTQAEIYIVADGRIAEQRTRGFTHPGGEYLPVYQGFKRWLLDTMRVREPKLVGEDVLHFTEASAEPMREWLERWRRRPGSQPHSRASR